MAADKLFCCCLLKKIEYSADNHYHGGMLEPWTLQHKAWKKRLAWKLYQHRELLSACLLHATSVLEAENLREIGFNQPIALIPNGIHLPAWNEQIKIQTENHTALFLGRIHPVKGLSELVKAWQIARPKGWRIVHRTKRYK